MSKEIEPATPLPWSISGCRTELEENEFIRVFSEVSSEHNVYVSYSDIPDQSHVDSYKDARYIAHACNEYPKLKAREEQIIEALGKVMAAFKSGDDSGSSYFIDDPDGELIETIATTLASIKGDES